MSIVKPLRMYRCEPPCGAPFECAVIDHPEDFTIHVISTRSGQWEIENEITTADLISPEQKLKAWVISRVEPREIDVQCLSELGWFG
jgi:hypothetical protein